MRYFLPLLLAVLSSSAFANEPRNYVVGYLDHPHIVNYYNPVIKQAYEDIGMKIELIPVGSKRGMELLNKGLIDADVARFETTAAQFDNVTVMGPVLVEAYFDLFCVKQVKCDSSVLDDSKNVLATYYGQLDVITTRYPQIKAQMFTLDSITQVLRLLDQGRFEYALLPSDDLVRKDYPQFIIHNIGRESTFHVVHKKHAHLQTALNAALAIRIKEAKARMAPESVYR